MSSSVVNCGDCDFSKTRLSQPRATQGGNYVTRIALDGSLETDTCVQLPTCRTKQGIVVSGRKTYCDLMYPSDDTHVMEWIERLEKRCQELIYEKREDWFHNPLTEDDIESAFTSSVRLYKSGKAYLVRVLLKGNAARDGEDAECVFNQRQEAVPYSEVTVDSKVIPLIKVDCIRFSARSFAIELTLPQLMVLEGAAATRGCMIRTGERPEPSSEGVLLDINETVIDSEATALDGTEREGNDGTVEKEVKDEEVKGQEVEHAVVDIPDEQSVSTECGQVQTVSPIPDGVTSVELDTIEPSDEAIELRKPNEVYRQIYEAALAKAKLAKKTAVEAYLEAKRIRHMYLLDDLDQSDDDDEMTEME